MSGQQPERQEGVYGNILFRSANRVGWDGANYFELGVRCVGVKLGEVVTIPELANLFV